MAKIRTAPVFYSEVKFAEAGRNDHLPTHRTITERDFIIYVNDPTLPGQFVFICRKSGRVYTVPQTSVLSGEVSPTSYTKHQPVGTHPAYDTKSGHKSQPKTAEARKRERAAAEELRKEQLGMTD